MTSFAQQVASSGSLTHAEQKDAGAPIQGKMDDKYKDFLINIKKLVESGEIDINVPKSFLKMDVYESLPEQWQDKSDLALSNIGSLLKQIYEFYISKETPDESPQYQTMIISLWQMKQSIEEHYDVFKF